MSQQLTKIKLYPRVKEKIRFDEGAIENSPTAKPKVHYRPTAGQEIFLSEERIRILIDRVLYSDTGRIIEIIASVDEVQFKKIYSEIDGDNSRQLEHQKHPDWQILRRK